MNRRDKCYVLDSTALIQGLTPTALAEDVFTVPEVVQEMKSNRVSSLRIEAAISSGSLKTKKPSRRSVHSIRDAMRALGEETALSETDRALLALALDLRMLGRDVTVISDDYAIQNVSARIGIPFVTVAASGIKLTFTWSLFCPACRRVYLPSKVIKCPVCGTTLKRRVVKKRRVQATEKN